MPPDANRISPSLRLFITTRAKGLCEYCKCPEEFSPDPFALDHIEPRQLGGETSLENLALLAQAAMDINTQELTIQIPQPNNPTNYFTLANSNGQIISDGTRA
jgi:5-methylcytosine-specific restriction endonuclease McrA